MMKKILWLLLCTAGYFLAGGESSAILWNFADGSPAADGGKIIMKLMPRSRITPEHTLLISGHSNTVPGGLRADRIYPELTPSGAFRLLIRFQIDAAAMTAQPDKKLMVLADNKSNFWPPANGGIPANSGLGVVLEKRGERYWAPAVYLGYGEQSAKVSGVTADLQDGKPHTLEVFFSGTGDVTFLIDGKRNAAGRVPPGGLAPAHYPFCIGDRAGASYWCFEGAIAGLELHSTPLAPLGLRPAGRMVFERTEAEPGLALMLQNRSRENLTGVKLDVTLDREPLERRDITLAPGQERLETIPLPTRLYPGRYRLEAQARTVSGVTAEFTGEITIVAELNPEAMPVVMWQDGDPAKVAAIGFTHQFAVLSPDFHTGKPGDAATALSRLDDNLRCNLRSCDVWLTQRHDPYKTRFVRRDRHGREYRRFNLEASNPELGKLVAADAERAAYAYGSHPGLAMLLVHSEVRDGSEPAFNGPEPTAYKAFSGSDIPAEVTGRQAPNYRNIPDFPVLGVIAETMPLYRYYRWWWQEGDGWNQLHSIVHQHYKKALGARAGDVTTFFDPSCRVPPLRGNGGSVDMLNQWSYSYPSPIKLATAVDEERAMARGGNQKLMKTTQAIWYRSPPAPRDKSVANPPAWVEKYPDAPYITIAPDHLQEAFWSKISRRLDAIAYHGYGSLVEVDTRPWNQYRLTNEHSREVLKQLIDTVVRPLGPVLKIVPERAPETVVLYTLGSNLFDTPGSWGWGWGGDAEMHQTLQRAGLDPAIVFDEDVLSDGLNGVKVLALPNCRIMARQVVDAIKKFQLGGGIVITDERLTPLILPDIVIDSRIQSTAAETVKAIRRKLGTHFVPYCDTDNADLVPHVRSYRNADYLFVLNDRRGFGDYVGMYGNVKEKGLPLSGHVSVRRNDIAAAYDLVARREAPIEVHGGKTTLAVDFQTNDGRLYLLLPRKIAGIEIKAPERISLDRPFAVTATIFDADHRPIEAIVPLQLELCTGDGAPAIGSGYYAAKDGQSVIAITPSRNDAKGTWQLKVTELASGQSAQAAIVAD